MSRQMYYINPRAGSGKTTAAIEYIVANIPSNPTLNYLIVAPTSRLVNQISEDIKAELKKHSLSSIFVYAIHKKSSLVRSAISVEATLRKYMTNVQTPKIIITTQTSFINLIDTDLKTDNSGSYKKGFMLILDEVMDIISGQLITSKHHNVVQSLFETTDKNELRAITTTDAYTSIQTLARTGKHSDPFLSIPILADLCKGYWNDCYKLKTIVHNKDKVDPKKITSIEYRSILAPHIIDGFVRPTILSAYFDKSIMHHVWKILGVNFVLDKNLMAKVKYPTHINGNLITFNYLQNNYEWITSKFDENLQETATTEIIDHLKSSGISDDKILIRYKGIKVLRMI